MECHKCEHRAAVEAGKFRGMAFEDTPCAFCLGPAESATPVSFSDAVAGVGALSAEASVPDQVASDEDPSADATPVAGNTLPVSVLVSALAAFLTLPDMDLRMVRLRRRGLSYEAIAMVVGSSPKAVSCRFKRLFERWPLLACLFPAFRGAIPDLPDEKQ